MDMREILDLLDESEELLEVNDSFDIELGEDLLIETGVVDLLEDGVVLEADEDTLKLLEEYGITFEEDWSKYDEPTIARIKKGVTKPVDKTDYDVPTHMRKAAGEQPKTGFDKRRASLIKQGIIKADEGMTMGIPSGEGSKVMGEAEVEESGLQAYLGKKKYGEKGMKALQQAGRDGASKEKMASIRAKYDKLDEEGVTEEQNVELSVDQLAAVSDEALDKAYGYGRSSPGNTFGWQANLKSAEYAKKAIMAGITDIEKISDMIHKGWNVTAKAFVKNPDQFSDTEKLKASGKLEAKLAQREKLMNIEYNQLPEEEKEKDRVVARALLQALTGKQDVAEDLDEAKYRGREVPLGKPMAGDVKKSKVYVKKPNGKVVKVNFGDKKMKIKKSNPKRRKSFRARHNCKNPGPRWKARYWSCRAW